MERTSNQPTFLDSLTSALGGRRTAQFFKKCDQLIPWNDIAEPLKEMYKNNTDKGGASKSFLEVHQPKIQKNIKK